MFGIGIELEGLVPKELYGNTIYQDPIEIANYYASLLKQKKCSLIICLSHLGFKYKNNKISDLTLARKTRYIDLIIGGHTHTFLKEAVIERNLEQKEMLINQVGWAGINVGRIDFHFNQNGNRKNVFGRSIFIKSISKNA